MAGRRGLLLFRRWLLTTTVQPAGAPRIDVATSTATARPGVTFQGRAIRIGRKLAVVVAREVETSRHPDVPISRYPDRDSKGYAELMAEGYREMAEKGIDPVEREMGPGMLEYWPADRAEPIYVEVTPEPSPEDIAGFSTAAELRKSVEDLRASIYPPDVPISVEETA